MSQWIVLAKKNKFNVHIYVDNKSIKSVQKFLCGFNTEVNFSSCDHIKVINIDEKDKNCFIQKAIENSDLGDNLLSNIYDLLLCLSVGRYKHPTAMSDLIRSFALVAYGGIYLDCDIKINNKKNLTLDLKLIEPENFKLNCKYEPKGEILENCNNAIIASPKNNKTVIKLLRHQLGNYFFSLYSRKVPKNIASFANILTIQKNTTNNFVITHNITGNGLMSYIISDISIDDYYKIPISDDQQTNVFNHVEETSTVSWLSPHKNIIKDSSDDFDVDYKPCGLSKTDLNYRLEIYENNLKILQSQAEQYLLLHNISSKVSKNLVKYYSKNLKEFIEYICEPMVIEFSKRLNNDTFVMKHYGEKLKQLFNILLRHDILFDTISDELMCKMLKQCLVCNVLRNVTTLSYKTINKLMSCELYKDNIDDMKLQHKPLMAILCKNIDGLKILTYIEETIISKIREIFCDQT
jgi:hypothetical protein